MNNGFYKTCYEQGLFTDLLLVCQGREFRVHKIILAGQSTSFHKACTVAMKEKAESRIELHDDPDLLARMLDFCYDKKNDVRVLGVKTCLHYSQLYTLGDKYGMPVLQRISSKGLTGLLKDVFPLKKAGKIEPAKIEPEIVKDLLATIAHIYHNTLHNDPLRKRLACVPWKSLTMSLYKDQCMEVLRDNPDYAWDVIIYSGDKIEDYSEY